MRTHGGQNAWMKTMTEPVARFKFTMASGPSPDCQRHQRASREPKERGGENEQRRDGTRVWKRGRICLGA